MKASCLAKDFKPSFLSCEKDQETIFRRLLVESRPYSDVLKRLLIINATDCLDESKHQYQTVIDDYSIKRMMDEKYLRTIPKLSFGEHEEVKSYIILEFDDFVPTENPQFRDCTVTFTIISQLDYWDLDDYKLRPWQIAGYVDGIMNNARLSGIGTLQFLGATQLVLNEYLGGVMLRYIATHGSDDYVGEDK